MVELKFRTRSHIIFINISKIVLIDWVIFFQNDVQLNAYTSQNADYILRAQSLNANINRSLNIISR